jgi:hypothetical protein
VSCYHEEYIYIYSADVQLEVTLPGDLLSVNTVQKAIDM